MQLIGGTVNDRSSVSIFVVDNYANWWVHITECFTQGSSQVVNKDSQSPTNIHREQVNQMDGGHSKPLRDPIASEYRN